MPIKGLQALRKSNKALEANRQAGEARIAALYPRLAEVIAWDAPESRGMFSVQEVGGTIMFFPKGEIDGNTRVGDFGDIVYLGGATYRFDRRTPLTAGPRRQIAASMARVMLRQQGISDHDLDRTTSAEVALQALLDMPPSQIEENWLEKRIARRWRATASPSQIDLFGREWRNRQRTYQRLDAGQRALAAGDLDQAAEIIERLMPAIKPKRRAKA